jgi:hypothetical protein
MTFKRTGIWWSLCLAFGTAAFGALLGLGLMLAYFVWTSDCGEGTSTLRWAVGLLLLLGLLAASYGFAYVAARGLSVSFRPALPMVGLVLLLILVAGPMLIPAVNDVNTLYCSE